MAEKKGLFKWVKDWTHPDKKYYSDVLMKIQRILAIPILISWLFLHIILIFIIFSSEFRDDLFSKKGMTYFALTFIAIETILWLFSILSNWKCIKHSISAVKTDKNSFGKKREYLIQKERFWIFFLFSVFIYWITLNRTFYNRLFTNKNDVDYKTLAKEKGSDPKVWDIKGEGCYYNWIIKIRKIRMKKMLKDENFPYSNLASDELELLRKHKFMLIFSLFIPIGFLRYIVWKSLVFKKRSNNKK